MVRQDREKEVFSMRSIDNFIHFDIIESLVHRSRIVVWNRAS